MENFLHSELIESAPEAEDNLERFLDDFPTVSREQAEGVLEHIS